MLLGHEPARYPREPRFAGSPWLSATTFSTFLTAAVRLTLVGWPRFPKPQVARSSRAGIARGNARGSGFENLGVARCSRSGGQVGIR